LDDPFYLGLCGHVNELISQIHHHATNDRGIQLKFKMAMQLIKHEPYNQALARFYYQDVLVLSTENRYIPYQVVPTFFGDPLIEKD
jgi:hypothetical protein